MDIDRSLPPDDMHESNASLDKEELTFYRQYNRAEKRLNEKIWQASNGVNLWFMNMNRERMYREYHRLIFSDHIFFTDEWLAIFEEQLKKLE